MSLAPKIIQQAIWLYLRFTLSFRDVEDLLAERGIYPVRRAERKLCVPNDKVGLPDKLLTADDALKLIAENMMEWTEGEKGH